MKAKSVQLIQSKIKEFLKGKISQCIEQVHEETFYERYTYRPKKGRWHDTILHVYGNDKDNVVSYYFEIEGPHVKTPTGIERIISNFIDLRPSK